MRTDSEDIGFVAFMCSSCGFMTPIRSELDDHLRRFADGKLRMKDQLDALDEQELEVRRRRKAIYQKLCGGGAA